MNNVCLSLGDCGAYNNIAGKYTNDGLAVVDNGKRRVIEGLLDAVADSDVESEEEDEGGFFGGGGGFGGGGDDE